MLDHLSCLSKRLQERIILSRIKFDPMQLSDVVVKIADRVEEYEAAARLSFEAYAAKGLLTAEGVRIRLTPYLMLPTTTTFVALRRGEVIGTTSLICDSRLGVPMASIFAKEIAALRAQGRRVAEVGALAIEKRHRGAGLAMLIYKAMWRTAVELLGIQDLVVAVHPAAEPMYTAPLRFERLANDVRRYPGLKTKALATALRLNLETAIEVFGRAFPVTRRWEFNPRGFFLQTLHPQIRLPIDVSALEAIRAVHQKATLRLAILRPDTVMDMQDERFQLLRDSLKRKPMEITISTNRPELKSTL